VPAGTQVLDVTCVTHPRTNSRAVAFGGSCGICPPPTGGLMSFQSTGVPVAVPSNWNSPRSCTAHAGVPLTTSPTHTIRARPPHHPRGPRSACAFLPILASPTPDTGSPPPPPDLMSPLHPPLPCP